jgi:hypothetical protein
MPNTPVTDVASAQSMADIINHHALHATNGLTYSEMGKFATADNNPAAPMTPTPPQGLRWQAGGQQRPQHRLPASALRTSLYSSVMAIELSTLVMGIGVMLAALGSPSAASVWPSPA